MKCFVYEYFEPFLSTKYENLVFKGTRRCKCGVGVNCINRLVFRGHSFLRIGQQKMHVQFFGTIRRGDERRESQPHYNKSQIGCIFFSGRFPVRIFHDKNASFAVMRQIDDGTNADVIHFVNLLSDFERNRRVHMI